MEIRAVVTRASMNDLFKKVKEQQIKFPPKMTEKQKKLQKTMEAWDAYGNTIKGYDKTLYSMMDELREGIEQLKSMEVPPQYRSRTLSFDEMAEIFADSGSAMFKEYIKIREKEKKEGLKNDYTK